MTGAALALLAPVPYHGDGRRSYDNDPACALLDWEGLAPPAFALEETLRDRPPSFAYKSRETTVCA